MRVSTALTSALLAVLFATGRTSANNGIDEPTYEMFALVPKKYSDGLQIKSVANSNTVIFDIKRNKRSDFTRIAEYAIAAPNGEESWWNSYTDMINVVTMENQFPGISIGAYIGNGYSDGPENIYRFTLSKILYKCTAENESTGKKAWASRRFKGSHPKAIIECSDGKESVAKLIVETHQLHTREYFIDVKTGVDQTVSNFLLRALAVLKLRRELDHPMLQKHARSHWPQPLPDED